MGYRISTPINAMLSEAREPPLHLRFTFIVSKYVYKSMAYKFSTSYEALKELEIIASQKNQKTEAIRSSNLFKSYIMRRPDKKTMHRATYPPAFWHEHKVMAEQITYVEDMLLYYTKDNPRELLLLFSRTLHQKSERMLSPSTLTDLKNPVAPWALVSTPLTWTLPSNTNFSAKPLSSQQNFGPYIKQYSSLEIA